MSTLPENSTGWSTFTTQAPDNLAARCAISIRDEAALVAVFTLNAVPNLQARFVTEISGKQKDVSEAGRLSDDH